MIMTAGKLSGQLWDAIQSSPKATYPDDTAIIMPTEFHLIYGDREFTVIVSSR